MSARRTESDEQLFPQPERMSRWPLLLVGFAVLMYFAGGFVPGYYALWIVGLVVVFWITDMLRRAR